MMKGFESLGIEHLDLDSDNVAEHDWFAEVSQHLIDTQQGDGYWPWDCWGNYVLSTTWALLTLEKSVPRFEIEVFVDIKPGSCPNPLNTGSKGVLPVAIAGTVDFDVTVIDDRADLLTAERLPDPIHRSAGDIEEVLRANPIDRNSYVVIVTRGHKHDEAALSAVIDSPARYLGMIGSKSKIRKMYESLKSRSVSEEQLQRVHAPIGLDIGAVTVPEIAVSIAGQLIATRREDYNRLVEGPFPIDESGR